MWKLPMFGCQSGDEVLAEIQNCQDEYPGYRVRVVGFDNVRQCQMAGFICRKEAGSKFWLSVAAGAFELRLCRTAGLGLFSPPFGEAKEGLGALVSHCANARHLGLGAPC